MMANMKAGICHLFVTTCCPLARTKIAETKKRETFIKSDFRWPPRKPRLKTTLAHVLDVPSFCEPYTSNTNQHPGFASGTSRMPKFFLQGLRKKGAQQISAPCLESVGFEVKRETIGCLIYGAITFVPHAATIPQFLLGRFGQPGSVRSL